MEQTQSPNRRIRRNQLRQAKVLKLVNSLSFFSQKRQEWYDRFKSEGKKIHEMNTNSISDLIENQLQIKLDGLKVTWESIGYNKDEIEMLEEAWSISAVKNKDSYREDIKKSRKLNKQAEQSRNNRK
jgi:hypothetical protein